MAGDLVEPPLGQRDGRSIRGHELLADLPGDPALAPDDDAVEPRGLAGHGLYRQAIGAATARPRAVALGAMRRRGRGVQVWMIGEFVYHEGYSGAG